MISSVRYTIRYIRMAFHGYSITFLQPAVSLVVSGTCSRIALHTAVGVQAFVLWASDFGQDVDVIAGDTVSEWLEPLQWEYSLRPFLCRQLQSMLMVSQMGHVSPMQSRKQIAKIWPRHSKSPFHSLSYWLHGLQHKWPVLWSRFWPRKSWATMLLLIPKFQHLQWMESTLCWAALHGGMAPVADVKIARSKRMSWLTVGIVFAVHTTCRKCRKNTKKKHPNTEETWDTWVMLVHTSVKHLVFQQRTHQASLSSTIRAMMQTGSPLHSTFRACPLQLGMKHDTISWLL